MTGTLLLLALTMFGECRGCSRDEMRAVGHVVMNRVKQERTSVAQEVRRPGQFAPARLSFTQRINPKTADWKQWNMALSLAENLGNDNTYGATFFKTTKSRVSWPQLKLTTRVGPHNFYRKASNDVQRTNTSRERNRVGDRK